uniref:SCP domain-containing protein n=1 Tax=Meloidogyne hapla TaxID=6305 RepID=A0A1I8BSX6_MELHA
MDILEISYSKVVESSAKSWASNCTFDHSGGGGGYGENLYLDGDYNHKNITAILVDACNAWWGESTTDGVPTSWLTNFLGDNDEDQFEKCGHLTQMAWAKTSQIGCALKVCHTPQAPGNYVVCRYNPFGNCEGEPIYKKGQPASGCGSAGKSSNYSGLCKP